MPKRCFWLKKRTLSWSSRGSRNPLVPAPTLGQRVAKFGSVLMNAHDVHLGSYGPVVVGLFESTLFLHSIVPSGAAKFGEPGNCEVSKTQPGPPMASGASTSSF